MTRSPSSWPDHRPCTLHAISRLQPNLDDEGLVCPCRDFDDEASLDVVTVIECGAPAEKLRDYDDEGSIV